MGACVGGPPGWGALQARALATNVIKTNAGVIERVNFDIVFLLLT